MYVCIMPQRPLTLHDPHRQHRTLASSAAVSLMIAPATTPDSSIYTSRVGFPDLAESQWPDKRFVWKRWSFDTMNDKGIAV